MRAHTHPRTIRGAVAAAVTALLASATLVVGSPAGAATDAFYTYSGSTPLASYKPGAVLKTRTLSYHIASIPLPLTVVQILFRSTDQQGRADAAVTSVIKPLTGGSDKVVGYQSFYDSLNPEDGPSRSIAGGSSLGGSLATAETALIAPLLLQGYSVVVTDTEGPTADFASGPEYGKATLDGIRAAGNASATGISRTAKVGLIGYSGGAIATNWAAALAPKYAPDVNKRLVGAAEGGVLVAPAHNLHYIDGSSIWAGVSPMALIGVSRAFGVDLRPYLSAKGLQIYTAMQHDSIAQVLGAYPGLTFAELAKPQYATPESIPVYVRLVNKVNLGLVASPTVPMFIGQGANGELEGTPGTKPGIGPGDGVMIAGDVRSLARKYCAAGTQVTYQQYDLTSHVTTVPLWAPAAFVWLTGRFLGGAATNNCSTIAPGNSLAATKLKTG